MKKYMSIVFVGTFLSGLPLVASQIPSEEKDPPKSGGFLAYLTVEYFRLRNDPNIEKSKFPTLTIQKLSDLLGETEGISEETLAGKSFLFETGSKEGAPDFYKGTATIESFDFGESRLLYQGPEKGFSQTVDHTTQVGKISPVEFLKKWLEKDGNPMLFKGNPDKESDVLTRLEYTIYNKKSTKYVKLKLRRERRN